MKGVELEGISKNTSSALRLPGSFRHKTKRPRPGLSRGTNRSNRFLPRETVQQEHSPPPEGWEWHERAIWEGQGFLWARIIPVAEVSGTIHSCRDLRDWETLSQN